MVANENMSSAFSSPSLLFFDTFYHEEALEEMHLDLVGFHRPVSIHEVRVIPHGCRVHAEIKDKLGETSPRSFKLEMFIKNLNKPNATVFEKLGTLDYVEGETLQLVTNSMLATNVVLLRGWYSRLTVCLYGAFTDVVLDHNQAPPPPPMDPGMMSIQRSMDQMRGMLPHTAVNPRGFEFEQDRKVKPEQEGRDRRGDERDNLDRKSKGEGRERRDGERSKDKDEWRRSRYKDDDSKDRERRSPDSTRGSNIKSFGETTKSATKTKDKDSRTSDSFQAGIDTLFEPLSPEDADFFDIPNDAGNDEIGYEDIESEEDNFDDFDFEETADLSNFQDLDLYGSEDTWMSVSVSFNPYQCYLSSLESFEPLGLSDLESVIRNAAEKGEEESFPEAKQLQSLIEKFKNSAKNGKWVSMLEEISLLLPNALATSSTPSDRQDTLRTLVGWTCQAIDFNGAMQLPVGVNIRQLKAGIKIASRLCRCSEEISRMMMEAGIQQKLLALLKTDHMASSMKLLIIQALDSTTDMAVGMENFLGWNLLSNDSKDLKTQESISLYEELVMYILTNPTVRVSTAIKCLLRKAHYYESLANFQHLAERISSSVRPSQEDTEMEEHQVKSEDAPMKEPEMKSEDAPMKEPELKSEDAAMKEPELKSEDAAMKEPEMKSEDAAMKEPEMKSEDAAIKEPEVKSEDAAMKEPEVKSEDAAMKEPEVKSEDAAMKEPKLKSEDTAMEEAEVKPEEAVDGVKVEGSKMNKDDNSLPHAQEIDGEESIITQDEIDTLISSLDDIYRVLENAQEIIAQPALKAFPTSMKIIETSPCDSYPTVFSFLQKRRFLESLLIIISSPVFCEPALFSTIRDMIFYLLDNEKGLLFLASEPNTVNGMIRVLTQSSESESHYSEAPPLKDLRYDSNAADNCMAHHLGLLLIYHLQSLQGIDQLIATTKNGIAPNEMDDADNLSMLHTLYSMTFTPIGKAAVTSVLSQRDNLRCLIPFVEHSDESEGKARRSVSSKYASVLLLLTLQMSDDVTALEKFGSKLLAVPKKEADTVLTELGHFLAPLDRIIRIDVNAIANLVDYIKGELDTFKTNPNSPRGIFTALRLLKHICIQPDTKAQVEQKDSKWNLCTIQLFSANAMDTCIQLLNKLGERLVTPWRQNQPFSNHQCSVLVNLLVPLLQLIRKMLVGLIDSGKIQFKDTRLLHGVFVLHTILCSKPSTGQLFTTIQKVQSEIVAILLKFTSVNAPESQEAFKASSWYLMLKELVQYTASKPQAFLSGVTLLSELVPVPLPVHSIQELTADEIATLGNHRLLWMAHIGAQANEIQSMLKSLVGSCCNSLQHSLRKLCLQLVDLGASTALSTVRVLCDILDDLLNKKEKTEEETEPTEEKSEEKPMLTDTHYVSRVTSLLSSVSSQPGGKLAFLQLIRGSKSKEEADFPNLLHSLLQLLSTSEETGPPSGLFDGILGLLLSVCDTEISMTELEEPMTVQDVANCLPSSEMMQDICQTLLSFIGSDSQSYQLTAQAIRVLVSFSDHDACMAVLKRYLKESKSNINSILTRIEKDISNKENQTDSIHALSTLFGFLQLLLPPASGEKPDPEDPTDPEEKNQNSLMFPQSSRNIHLSFAEMKEILDIDQESTDHVLSKIEQSLKEASKEDEGVGSFLEAMSTFDRILLSNDSSKDETEAVSDEMILPKAESLKTVYGKRISHLSAILDDDRIAPMLWFLSPPSEDVEIDSDMVKVDLEQIAEKYCPGFNLKEEVEKGFLTTDDDHAKRAKRSRRKYDPLVHGKGAHVDDMKRQRFDVSYFHRGRGGFRGRGRGFGRGYVDMFRSRKQNTSRPPSMHVDDFVMMESTPGSGDSQMKPPSKSSFAPVREANSEPRFTGGFNTTQGRWASPNPTSFRREGQHPQMGRAGFDNWNVSRAPVQGTFSPQYGRGDAFQRGGSNWSPQIASPYRAPRESQSPYQRSSFRGGYWAGPKTKEDNRFFAGGGFGSYRQSQGNDRGGFSRHVRTLTR